MGRLKNKLVAKLLTRFPSLFQKSVAGVAPAVSVEGVPWTPVTKPLGESTVAMVTTAGVHLKGQPPFDMEDPDGDPSFRELPSVTPRGEYAITHDYYDHSDADRDINVVFPMDRLNELAGEGVIGGLAAVNYGFMGHIDGPHIKTLMEKTGPDVARRLADEGADVVLLTPG